MDAGVRTIRPLPLDTTTWSPFGWLPVADSDPADGTHRLAFAWHDVHVNRIKHRREEVPTVARGLRCQMLFRHVTHTQVLMPLDATAVVAVAPAGLAMDSASDLASVAAFMLRPLQAVVLHRGTWHWGPFPVVAESVELFNVQGLRYREDNQRVDLDGSGIVVEVGSP
jgi:ureidoglycolate hydrolase